MANIVEFLVKIRDMASGPFARIASVGDSTFSRLSNRVSSFNGQFNRLGSSIDQINSKLKDLERTRNMSVDSSQIRRINREMQELEGRRNRLLPGEHRGGGGLGLGHLAGLLGVGSAMALGGTVVKAGMDRQMAGTAFQVMAGKEQGAALHQNLIKFATDSIYGNEVFGEAKTMLSFGIGAKQVMPALKMLGDVAMGDVEHMKSLSLAFAQTASAGKLTGQDMLQYVNAGFNPLQAMSEKTGISMAVLRKEVEKGKISFQDVAGAFQYATGPMGRFHNGMKNMAETPTGKWIAFTGALETLGGTIGMKVLPALGGVATFLNGIITNDAVFNGIAAGIGAMTLAWGLYTVVTQRAAIWQGVLQVIAFWPIAVIGTIIGLITYLCYKYDSWGQSAKAAWEITKAFFSDMKLGLTDFAQTVAYAFESSYLRIKDFFQQIGGAWQKVKQGDIAGAWSTPIQTQAGKELVSLTQQHLIDRINNKAGIMANYGIMSAYSHNFKFDLRKGSSGISPTDILAGKGGAAGGSMPSSMADTNKGISGGGVRNLTINVANLGTGKIDIHAATVTEGKEQIRRIFEEMFLQVVNSGNAAVA